MTQPQITSLLSNADLGRLERMRINASRHFTNRGRGEHLAGKGNSTTQFCDYRDYSAGDDVRFIDWNIFSRLNKPYMKVFHQEEELHVVIMIDASSSMRFQEKLDRARQIAAAFGVLGLRNTERVSVHALRGGAGPSMLRPCTGRASMRKLFTFIESIESGGDAPLETAIESALKFHTGRGVVVLLSDFLSTGDLKHAFNSLFSAGLEIFALQILAPDEINPGVTGDIRLVDCETQQHLDVSSAAGLLELYQEYREAYERNLATLCQQRSGRFLSTSSAATVGGVMFDILRRKGWVA